MGKSLNLKAAVITTVDHNIGDDFVREGIFYLLQEAGLDARFRLIHKHTPITSYPAMGFMKNSKYASTVDRILRRTTIKDAIDWADVVIQSGAPIYWCHPGGPHCADNEWFNPLIRERFKPGEFRKPFLNLAGGSCQRYESNGSEISSCPKCRPYIQLLYDVSKLTTLRDTVARNALNSVGRDAVVLPCTSIFARDRFGIKKNEPEYVVLNFMENGAHYTFGQEIDGFKWRNQFIKLANMLSRDNRVVVACHDKKEFGLVSELVPNVERFLIPNDYRAFLEFYSRASWGILNRVHGAFAMASFGRPAAVIGNDTRARMVSEIGLESYYVDDVEQIGLEGIVDSVMARKNDYESHMTELKQNTKRQYVNALREAIGV